MLIQINYITSRLILALDETMQSLQTVLHRLGRYLTDLCHLPPPLRCRTIHIRSRFYLLIYRCVDIDPFVTIV